MTEKEILEAINNTTLVDHINIDSQLNNLTPEEKKMVVNMLMEFKLVDLLSTKTPAYQQKHTVSELKSFTPVIENWYHLKFDSHPFFKHENEKLSMHAHLEQIRLFLASHLAANESTYDVARKLIDDWYVSEFKEKYPDAEITVSYDNRWVFSIDVSKLEPLLAATIVPTVNDLYEIRKVIK